MIRRWETWRERKVWESLNFWPRTSTVIRKSLLNPINILICENLPKMFELLVLPVIELHHTGEWNQTNNSRFHNQELHFSHFFIKGTLSHEFIWYNNLSSIFKNLWMRIGKSHNSILSRVPTGNLQPVIYLFVCACTYVCVCRHIINI